ncbi:MAG TPA: serine/threonine-protein phosphatase [Gammaproteobacteria bacterium]|nr:serine/threonine-protein phosphatase [Gammaproteobacteria bacterium]
MHVVHHAAGTHVGNVREHNEDYFRVNTDIGLYVVADGLGGHASGEVASEIAVETIEQQVKQGASLVEAIERAHHAILRGVETGAGKTGMGTTVVAIQLHENDYTLAWVGDSRAYLWSGELQQISKDHSLVQMLIDSGQISEVEARMHPRKNVIYQNLGAEELDHLRVSVKHGSLYKGQKLILCSDGLSDEVDDDTINNIITQGCEEGRSGDEMVDELIDAALEKGGQDNISIIIVSAPEGAQERERSAPLGNNADKDTLVPQEQE